MTTPSIPENTCLECGTVVGGENGKDPYKHLLLCLHIEPDAHDRIRDNALSERNEHGRRVLHILDGMVSRPVPSNGEGV